MKTFTLKRLGILLTFAPMCACGEMLSNPVLQQAQYMSYATAYRRLVEADMDVDAAWRKAAHTPDFAAFRQRVRNAAIASFGGFPERTPLNVRVTDVRVRDAYRIEKVLIDSLPGFPVPMCVYVPNGARFKPPYPAVVVPCGHSEEGKAQSVYQYAGVALAQAGFVAAVFDPIDQGERRQTPDHGVCGRGHNALGALAMLLGESGLRIRLWDAMRVVDYLTVRTDVDAARVGVMGNSGGGTMSAMLAAFGDRIRAAAPASYISSLRRVVADCGPQDSEQILFGQLAWGLNHLGLVLLRTPTPTLVCASHDDFFPIDGTLETMRGVSEIAQGLGCGDRYALVESSGKHGWKAGMLTASIDWMRRWLCDAQGVPLPDSVTVRLTNAALPPKVLVADKVLPEAETFVTKSGNVSEIAGHRSVYKVLCDELEGLVQARAKCAAAECAQAAVCAAGIRPLAALGMKTLEGVRMDETNRVVTHLAFVAPDGFTMPGVLVAPTDTHGTSVLLAGDGGRAAFAADVAKLNAEGRAALVVDLEGYGEIGVTKRRVHVGSCVDDGLGKIHYLMGDSLVGRRAEQLLVAADELRRRFGQPPELVTEGFVAIPAAHACAASPSAFAALTLRNPPMSWSDAVRHSVTEPIQWTFSDSVQGALRTYDWVNLLPEGITKKENTK